MHENVIKTKLQICLSIMAAVAVFAIVCVFFIGVHPIVLFDMDDWRYIAEYRRPFPIWGGWNPARVFPETVMPLAGYAAAYLVKPLVGDYVLAITVTSGVIMALAVVMYYLAFKKFVSSIWHVEPVTAVVVSLFFILAHFGLFRSQDANNVYMFFALDLTCYYFYLLPALLNASLVLYFMAVQDFPKRFYSWNNVQKGIAILGLYLAVFSNLFASAILVLFCMVKLGEVSFKKGKQHQFYVTIILIWFLALLFEANGGDAVNVGKNYSYLHLPVAEALAALGTLARQIDWSYVGLMVVSLVGAAWVYCKKDKREPVDENYRLQMLENSSSILLVFIFLTLLCAKATPAYAGRIQSMFGLFFFALLLTFNAGMYLLRQTSLAGKMLPLIFFMFLIIGTNSFSPFSESNFYNRSPYECMEVSRYFITQVQQAAQAGKHEMVLKVPKGATASNWPHLKAYFGEKLAHTLLAHGLINHPMKITIAVDPALNKQFYK